MKYILFPKSSRGTFKYWYYHWKAFNNTAKSLGVWKFHHLFHDIEKPFLRLFLPYSEVQKIHRRNNPHHIEYKRPERRNWIDLVIDWECSRLTKIESWRNVYKETEWQFMQGQISWEERDNVIRTAKKLGINE